MKNLRVWTDVYPQGSKEGDEEQGFFIAISRHLKWKWRSVAQLSKEANLSKQRVEEIIQKYHKRSMILQCPTNDDMWGYWENHLDLLPKTSTTPTQDDHRLRIKNAKS
jgi:hypothetical protein